MLRRSLLLLLSVALLSSARAQSTPPLPYLQEAFYGIDALQSWYIPSTGLYQTTGYWNAGNAITVLANYSRLDGTDAFYPIFANTLQQTPKSYPGFLDGYYDDEGWWALAWIDVYDLTKKPEYLTTAQSIFTDMTTAWDNTCGGGIWWNSDRKYKNAIANELFLSVASGLSARATNATDKASYLSWAQREWTWFQGSGMINGQNLINDGLDTPTCKNNGQTVWSYNQGVILGGLNQLSKITSDTTLVPTAQTIANAAITHLSDANGVLHDVCEPNCGSDGPQFKGVFLRNLMALQYTVHDPAYKTFADTNAQSIWTHDQGPNYQFGQVWTGPFDAGNGASQGSALDALLAAASMEPGALAPGSAPAFTLTASPETLVPTPGVPAQTSVTLTPGSSFTGSVSLSVTAVGAPAGVQASLSSPTLTGASKAILSVTTTGATPGGTYQVAVTGVSGGLAQTAYVTLALPDFSLGTTSSAVYLNQSGTVADPIAATDINGFAGYVTLAASALPTGVTGRFLPKKTASSSTLELTADAFAPTSSGTTFSVSATSGPTTHTAPVQTIAVSAAASTCGLGIPVDLDPAFNLVGLRSDGSVFSDGGLDGIGSAFSSTLLGPSRVLNGIRFTFGPGNAPNAVYAAAQVIALPKGHFNALQLLGTGINGDQTGQALTVTYADGSTAQFAQSFSDWFSPALKTNELEAVAMAYRNTSSGAAQKVQFNLYGYTLALDPTKTVKSLTLPANRSVILFAASLSLQDFGHEVNLADAFNAVGVYTDGSSFSNTGGLDAGGTAYSANLLGDTTSTGNDIVVGTSHFHLAPPNTPNAVYGAGQTIPLPHGFYGELHLLGSGVGGNQTAESIRVTYTDGTAETVSQTFSDWFSQGGFADESLAIRTAYRDTSNGSRDSEAFNVYLYTLKLNLQKQVESITLPNDRDVVLLGITLAPPPLRDLLPFACRLAQESALAPGSPR